MQRWVSLLDVFIWGFVFCFFLYFSEKSGGDVIQTILASLGVVVVMTVIGVCIEIIIDVFQNIKGLGTFLGFLTNGPEMVVLLVGIIANDPLFGVSTPLGSSVINPLMLILAALATGMLIKLLKAKSVYGMLCVLFTAFIALVFYLTPVEFYPLWLIVATIGTVVFFFLRPKELKNEDNFSDIPRWVVVPAIIGLIVAGYYLDPVVEFAGEVSGAPKNTVGFLVLAALSSWPEFKSCVVLFKKKMILAASNNIFVSNITNIWLATAGVLFYLF